jgi:hypothetical protein
MRCSKCGSDNREGRNSARVAMRRWSLFVQNAAPPIKRTKDSAVDAGLR